MATSIMLVTLVSLAVCVTLSWSCQSDVEFPTHSDKVFDSDLVAYGYVTSRTRDDRYPDKEIWTVAFQVRCIFKGEPLAEDILILHVGEKDRMCQTTNLTRDGSLLVYLRRLGGNRFVSVYQADPGDEQFQEEVQAVCGVTITYPEGYSESKNREQCMKNNADPSDCYPLPTARPDSERWVGFTTDKVGIYQPVKSPDVTNIQVEVGDQAGKGGKMSEITEQGEGNDEIKPTTPSGSPADNRASLVVSIGLCILGLVGVREGVRG